MHGKKEAMKKFVKVMTGPKRKDYERSEKRHGVHKETWFLQNTPVGEILLMYLEVDDAEKALSAFATDTDPFDIWARQQLKDLTGIDFSQPPRRPPAEQLFKLGY